MVDQRKYFRAMNAQLRAAGAADAARAEGQLGRGGGLRAGVQRALGLLPRRAPVEEGQRRTAPPAQRLSCEAIV